MEIYEYYIKKLFLISKFYLFTFIQKQIIELSIDSIIIPEKLQVEPQVIRNSVEGLLNLLLECCKAKVFGIIPFF